MNIMRKMVLKQKFSTDLTHKMVVKQMFLLYLTSISAFQDRYSKQ
jgi:hypothetical protein